MAPSQKYLLAASLLLMMSALTWWSSVSIRQAEQLAATAVLRTYQTPETFTSSERQAAESKIINSLSALVGLIRERLGVTTPAPEPAPPAPTEDPATWPDVVPGEYYIRYTPTFLSLAGTESESTLAAALNAELRRRGLAGAEILNVFPKIKVIFVRIPAGTFSSFDAAVKQMGQADLLVQIPRHRLWAKERWWGVNALGTFFTGEINPRPVQLFPNDPYFQNHGQWYHYSDEPYPYHLADTQATFAWAMDTGELPPHPAVALIDSRIARHPEFFPAISKPTREKPRPTTSMASMMTTME